MIDHKTYNILGGLSKVLVEKLASLDCDVLQLHCQQILVVIIHSSGMNTLSDVTSDNNTMHMHHALKSASDLSSGKRNNLAIIKLLSSNQ